MHIEIKYNNHINEVDDILSILEEIDDVGKKFRCTFVVFFPNNLIPEEKKNHTKKNLMMNPLIIILLEESYY